MAMFMHPLVAARSTGPRLYSTPVAGLGAYQIPCGQRGAPVLRFGTVSPCVATMRSALAAHGFPRRSALPTNPNLFDAADTVNVVYFQATKGFSKKDKDGVVGVKTWPALLSQPQAAPQQPLGPEIPLGLETKCPAGTFYAGSDENGRLICNPGGLTPPQPEQPPTIRPPAPQPGPGPRPPAPQPGPGPDKPGPEKTWRDRLKDPKTLLMGAGGLLVVGGLVWAAWPSKNQG